MSTDSPSRILRVARIIQLAMVASIAMYAVVLWVVSNQPRSDASPVPPTSEQETTYWIIIAAATLAALAAALVVPNVVLNEQRLRAAILGERPSATSPSQPLMRGVTMAWVVYILRLALFEMTVMPGLIVGLMTYDLRFFIPGGVIAALAMIASPFHIRRVEQVHQQLLDEGRLPSAQATHRGNAP